MLVLIWLTHRCEYSHTRREIVTRDIDTNKLLHELRSGAQKEAADRAGAGLSVPGLTPEQIGPFDGVLFLVLYRVDDLLVLSQDKWVIGVFVFDICKDLECLVLILMCDQPSWRLWQPGNGAEEDDDEDHLEGEGKPPRDSASEVGEPISHPVGQ